MEVSRHADQGKPHSLAESLCTLNNHDLWPFAKTKYLYESSTLSLTKSTIPLKKTARRRKCHSPLTR